MEDNTEVEDDSGREHTQEATGEDLTGGDKQSGDAEQHSAENEKPKTENDDEQEESKLEGQEPSGEGGGATEQQQSGSGAETSRKIEVPNNKVSCLVWLILS